MINLSNFSNCKIGIFGLGKTGLDSLNAFSIEETQIIAWDDNKENILRIKKTIDKTKNIYFSSMIDPFDVKKLDFVIVSPGVPNKYPAPHKIFSICERYNIPVITDIDILFKACPVANYVGVTGTNGKSTTASLINHILGMSHYKSALGGNIGKPVLSLPNFDNPTENYVIELSSYQLDLMQEYKFNVATLLSVTPDHLDRYESFDDYKNAKIKIFHNQNKNDFAVISLNNEVNRAIFKELKLSNKQKIIPISSKEIVDNGISVMNNIIYDNYFEHKTFNIIVPNSLIGPHNAENIAVAYAAAKALNVEIKSIINSLNSFIGLPHRMELFFQTGNLTFVNDSKATNIASCKEVLDSFKDIYWIAGGIFKEKSVEELGNHLKEVRHCYLIGKDSYKFIQILKAKKIPYSISNTIENALSEIKDVVKGGTILLSPCCSSFDQWKNFEERGDVFKSLVSEMFLT
jgi:UDP-N-acetylmuramoylalanine--D-glutamate ligase